MTKREAEDLHHQRNRLAALGIPYGDAETLRRISMTLRRWSDLECGDGNDYGSWCIERDDNGDGKPFMVHHHYAHSGTAPFPLPSRTPIQDRERGALRRLAILMSGYPDLTFYHQTDPRGCALYIVKRADVAGLDISSVYTRGVAVA